MTIRPFRMGKTEVTRGQFRAFVNATSYHTDAERGVGGQSGCYAATWKADGGWGDWGYKAGRSWRDAGFPQTDAHPVVCVSWNDAKAFIEWLNQETGLSFRLPSEAEWEYAARAGSASRFAWGNAEHEACRHGNVADTTPRPGFQTKFASPFNCSDGHFFTAPIGQYASNAFGLQDVAGNVWEWTEDCWNESYQGAPTDGRAWLSGDCSRRVARGGGWANDGAWLRVSFRDGNGAAFRNGDRGFRLAQDR